MAAIRSTGAPADSAGFLMWRLSNAWQRAMRGALEPLGITHAQFLLLATVDWLADPQGVKQHQVAQMAGMDPMTASQLARALEQRELVRRQPHPEDKRAFTLVLTAQGRRMLAKATPAAEAVDEQFFAAAAAVGPQQQKVLETALRLLVERYSPVAGRRAV